jgi:hypothetical protein
MMVAAYALGVLGPAVAFAHADHAAIMHVLGESHGGVLTLHFHEDDGDHHDHPAKPGSGPTHHCCGVVSLPGLEPSAVASIMPPQAMTALLPPAASSLSGCDTARLERPPRPLLTA